MRPVPLLLAVAWLAVAGPPAIAQAPKGGLDFVPSTAGGFVTVKLSDLMAMESMKAVRDAVARIEKLEGGRLTEAFGVSLDEIDRVTVFWPTPLGVGDATPEPYVIVTAKAPFNEARVLKTLRAMPAGEGHRHGKEVWPTPAAKTEGRAAPPPPAKDPLPPKFERPGSDGAQEGRGRGQPAREGPAEPAGSGDGPDLFYLEKGPFAAVYLIDDRTLFFLSEGRSGGHGLIALVGQLLRRKADGPLAAALAEGDKHTVVAAARLQLDSPLFADPDRMGRELVPFRTLFKAQLATLTADLGPKAALTARLTFADAATARRAEPVLKTLIQTAVDALAELKKDQGAKDADWAGILSPVIDLAVGALDKADVKADGTAVTARVEADIGPALTKFAAALPERVEAAATRMKAANNLKQIGLAIHNFHDTNGHMPTNILGPDGKPLLSWRVAILPFVEQDNLYRQLDLTKAWDDPQNAKLLAKMPDVFRVPGRDAKEKTYLQMPTSPKPIPGGDPFQVIGKRVTFATVADGLSNTIMVVEAADAVDWAKPDDLVYDPDRLPAVGDPDRKTFQILLGDGSVRSVRRTIDKTVLKALFTVNGAEPVGPPD